MEKAQRWDEIGLIVDGSLGDKPCRIWMAPATRPGCDVEFLSLRGSQAFFLHQSILVGGLEHVLFSISYMGWTSQLRWTREFGALRRRFIFWGSFKRPDTQPGASLKRENTQAFRQIPTDPYHSYPMGLERRVAWTYKPKNIRCHFWQPFLADLFAAACGASFNVPRRTIQNLWWSRSNSNSFKVRRMIDITSKHDSKTSSKPTGHLFR